jgi:hypothetical protein
MTSRLGLLLTFPGNPKVHEEYEDEQMLGEALNKSNLALVHLDAFFVFFVFLVVQSFAVVARAQGGRSRAGPG